MKCLQDTVASIRAAFPQELIDLTDYDLNTRESVVKKLPKYLFRGERTQEWTETRSTSSRKGLLDSSDFQEINYWLAGHGVGQIGNQNSIYFFLREAIFDISCVYQRTTYDSNIDTSIAGFLQHYGFDTSFIDLTSDISVAAFFAAHEGTVGDIGQLLVLPTKPIEGGFFDLSQEFANRPKQQHSFVILAPPDFDLKSRRFQEWTNSVWIKFELTQRDKEIFTKTNLLSTINDKIADHIVDWYDTHIKANADISVNVRDYFSKAINNLLNDRA